MNRTSKFAGFLVLAALAFALQVSAAPKIDDDEPAPPPPSQPSTGPVTVSVNSNISATWTVNPGSYTTYNSTSGSNTITASSDGTVVSVGAGYKSGYTASCSPSCSQVAYPGDVLSFQITYTPSEGQPVVSFTANPNSISPGDSSTLSWSVTSPDYGDKSCKTNWDGQVRLASGSVTVAPSQSTTYSITCTNSYTIDPNSVPYTYSTTASTLVSVESQAGNPTGVIYGVVPTTNKAVGVGGSLAIAGEFEWSNVFYVASFDIQVTTPNNSVQTLYSKTYCFNQTPGCTWTDGAGSTSYSGSYTFTTPGTYTIRYHGLAKNSTGAVSEPVETRIITVGSPCPPGEQTCEDDPNPPTASLSASPNSLQAGQSTTYSYSCGNSTRATASWSSQWLPTSGTYTTSYSQAGNYSHTVSCYNDANEFATAQASVSVAGQANTLSVSSNVPSSWTVTADSASYSGSGLSSSHNISPSPSGTTYTISYGWPAGYCSVFVRNSVTGDARPMTLYQGQSGSFSLEYLPCQQTCQDPAALNYGGELPCTYAAGFNYSLSNSGTTNAAKGPTDVYTTNTITKTLQTGTTQAVDLTLSGVPNGVTYSISNRACSPDCSSVITFTVSPGTPTGTHPITVTGTPGNKTTNFNLVVTASANITTTCVADPQVAEVGKPVVWTASAVGGEPPYTYRWSGDGIPEAPAPTTNPYTVTYSTLGQKSARVEVRDSRGRTNTCQDSTVQVNFNPRFEEF